MNLTIFLCYRWFPIVFRCFLCYNFKYGLLFEDSERFEKKMIKKLFIRKKKNKDVENIKGASKKGRNKNNKKRGFILSTYNLDESVMDMIYEVLNRESGAVRKSHGGYIVIVLTNDFFENLKKSEKADMGAFIKAISDKDILGCIIPEEIDKGNLILIPTEESFERLEEFGFIRNGEFNFCYIPKGYSDECGAIEISETKIDFKGLKKIADDKLSLSYADGIVTVGDEILNDKKEQNTSDEVVNSGVLEEVANGESEIEDEPQISEAMEEDLKENVDLDDIEFDNSEDNLEDSEDTKFDLEEDLESEGLTSQALEEPVEAEEIKIDDVLFTINRNFQNDDLGLNVSEELFNSYFTFIKPTKFKFSDSTSGESTHLDKHLNYMAETANNYLDVLHTTMIAKMKNEYVNSMSKICEAIGDDLSIEDGVSTFSKNAYDQICKNYENTKFQKADIISAERDELIEKYNKKRDEAGEEGRNNALKLFDARNNGKHSRELDELEMNFDNIVKGEFESAKSDFYDKRRQTARVMFDTMSQDVMESLNKVYAHYMKRESSEYAKIREKFDEYIEKNYSNDIMRAKALADELKHNNDLELMQKKYDAMLSASNAELIKMRSDAEARFNKLSDESKQEIKLINDKYERKLAEKNAEIKDKYQDLKKLQEDYAQADDRKKLEFEHRLNQKDDEIEAKNVLLKNMSEESKKRAKVNIFVTISIALLFLGLGIAVGFTFIPKG